MSASPAAFSEASPFDAARDAFEHTRRVLFPFRFDFWLALGLVAFLEQCGRGGIGGTIPGGPPGGVPGGGEGGDGIGSLGELGAWFTAHLGLIVSVAAVVLVFALALTALILWIGSRATFVYVDDVVSGRAEITRPWKAHAERASSFFVWRFGLAMAILAGIALLLVAAVGAIVTLGRRGDAGSALAVVALVVLVPIFFVLLLAASLFALALRDFVAPLQIHGDLPCGAAVRVLWGLVRAQPVPFVLYVVLKIAFGIGQGVVIILAACLTCCLALIPVVTQTALQPLFFFERAWSLHFLRRLGYDLFSKVE